MVENGKISYPIDQTTLTGNSDDALHNIKMIGNEMELEEKAAECGKEGQWVPSGGGVPSVLISDVVVGGTNT